MFYYYCISYLDISSFIFLFYLNPILTELAFNTVYRQTRRVIFKYANVLLIWAHSRNKTIIAIRQLSAILW